MYNISGENKNEISHAGFFYSTQSLLHIIKFINFSTEFINLSKFKTQRNT
jgi:hypothetical protein